MLDRHNCLDLLGELDQRIHLRSVPYHMLSLAVGRNTFVNDILDLAEREVENAPNGALIGELYSFFLNTPCSQHIISRK